MSLDLSQADSKSGFGKKDKFMNLGGVLTKNRYVSSAFNDRF
jgi:hypothetical protein